MLNDNEISIGFNTDDCIEQEILSEVEPIKSLVQDDIRPVPVINSPKSISYNQSNHHQMLPSLPNYQRRTNPLVNEIMNVPLSMKQSQELKATLLKSEIETTKHFNIKSIDYVYQVSIHQMKQEGQGSIPGVIKSTPSSGGDDVRNGNLSKTSILHGFIYKYKLVKVTNAWSKKKYDIMSYNIDSHHHEFCDDKDLHEMLDQYVEDLYGEYDVPNKVYERCWKSVFSVIPTLENSELYVVPPHQVAFANGIYDLKKIIFSPSQDKNYFTRLAVPRNFDPSMPSPRVFKKLLSDMFKGDGRKIQLVFEIIGAIISLVPNLKKIFCFGGVTGAGKSRLVRIIRRIIGKINVKIIEKIADLNKPEVRNKLKSYKLIVIEEAPEKKISPDAASQLKILSSGDEDINVRMIIETNHPLYTNDDGTIEKALESRILWVPFEEAMDNSDPEIIAFEDTYLETEIDGIIKESLAAFGVVLNNGGKFSYEFPINSGLNNQSAQSKISEKERENMENIISQQESKPYTKIETVIDGLFVQTAEANPEVTTNYIADYINQVNPAIKTSPELVGNALKNLYGEKLAKGRNSAGNFYGLTLRSAS